MKLFLTFSEVQGVSSIVNLFLSFWKVKSGKGGAQAEASCTNNKEHQRTANTRKKHPKDQQKQHRDQKQQHKQPRAQKAGTEGLFVLSLASSRGISVVFLSFF